MDGRIKKLQHQNEGVKCLDRLRDFCQYLDINDELQGLSYQTALQFAI